MQQSIIGQVIDNYQITGILGKGGMGVVYKAKDMTLDRDVAVKMMDAAFARDEEFLKRFKQEAKALAKLQNPNIVSVFALRETELGFALVMEFVDGNTLADRIRSGGAMPLGQVLPVFRQLLTALDHAHRVGIVHRDIKPGNVMLTTDDVVKVTDFGLAKIQQVSSATVTMGTGGTLYYMSPEQVRGLANVDARGDIYSLGMTLFEAITGRVPFGNDVTDYDIRQMIVEGKIPTPDRFNAKLPRGIIDAVMKAIERDPEKRFQSAAEMWDTLSKTEIPDGPVSARPTPAVIRPAPNLKKHSSPTRPLYITLAIGVVLIAGYFAVRSFLSGTPAAVYVISEPPGSSVIINGKTAGITPLLGFAAEPGAVRLSLAHDGYESRDTTINVAEGKSDTVSVVLSKEGLPANAPHSGSVPPSGIGGSVSDVTRKTAEFAILRLKAVPEGTVSVDQANPLDAGNEVKVGSLKPGEHSIRFDSPKYGRKTIAITVKAGETKNLTCYFEAYLNIVVLGDAQGGTLVIDGKQTDASAPVARYALAAGRHRVTVTKFGMETLGGEKEVTVVPSLEEKTIPLAFELKRK